MNIIMNKQEKLAELHSIRTILDKVAKVYCITPDERNMVKKISMRLFTEQILPLAEELTAQQVKDTKKLVTTASVQLIDLGLPSGTLWADRNVGADAPEAAGDYFRWGETVPFTEDSDEYEYRDLGESIVGTEYDAATVNLGEQYKMPTHEQQKELLKCCTWEWTTLNGVKGMKITGPNGNHIFFPASGYRDSSSGTLSSVGSYGFYCSASASSSYYGHNLLFTSSNWYWDNYYRAYGFPVRAVA